MDREPPMSYLTKSNIADIYPLSPMQQGMLFHSLYDQETSAYFEQFCCTMNGTWDFGRLEDAWNYLVDQHPVFRTVFNWKDASQPVQLVLKKRPISLILHDLKGLDDAAQQERIEAFLVSDRKDPLDLAKGPLMRLNVLELTPQKHYFVWSYHHILLDGWCLSLIMTDLVTVYNALQEGSSPVALNRPAYKDYIAWIAKQDKDKAKGFWNEYLEGFNTPTPLPWDHKAKGDKLSVSEQRLQLTESITQRLESFAREQRITLSTLLQAAWAILLGRYSGNDDIVFGSTISGRPADLPGAEEIIGLFINSLPVRAKLTSTVEELLRAIQGQSLKIQEYGYSFLPDVKACTEVPHTKSLFDSIVVFENYPLNSLLLPSDNSPSMSDIRTLNRTNFDITLLLLPGDRVELSLAYAADRFKDETIPRILDHLTNILLAMVEDPSRPAAQVEIMGSEEKKNVLQGFNVTTLPYPRESALVELFESRVDEMGSRDAVVFENKVLGYDELNAQANMLAHCLRTRGVKPGVIVGMMVGCPVESIVAIIAILKAGGGYLPIDPECPQARIEYMLETSMAPVVVSKEEFFFKLPPGIDRVCMDGDSGEVSWYGSDNPGISIAADDVAYAMYTSGSTGRPKGILIPHRGVVNLVHALDKVVYSNYTGFLRVGQVASFSFDASVQQIFTSLLFGHTLYPIPGDMKRDTTQLISYILRHGIEVIDGTPSLWELMVGSGIADEQGLKLKHIIIGGETLPVSLVERFFQGKCSALVRWTNVYGVTEGSVDSTSYSVDIDAVRKTARVPIGSPLANTKIYILDRDMNSVPIGVAGELHIGGDGLALGYLNDSELTEERFIDDPINHGGRLYRTGDMGRWLPDGNIEFLGRIDYQVKIRGFRVELGEVESVLAEHPAVIDCVAVDRADASGDRFLVAYYASDQEIPVSELREFLGRSLPDYMIPLRFIRLDALPLNTSGKVDRRALPEPTVMRPEVSTEYAAARNDLEQTLVEVWMEVLGLDTVGIHDNFFDLGGDSIISLQVVGRLNKRGYEIRPRDIFDRQTIAKIAPVVGISTRVKAEQCPVIGTSPLTPIQRWFFSLGLENENHFNQALMFSSTRCVDEAALKMSLQALLNHHDAMRMRFADGMQENIPPGEDVLFVAKDVGSEGELYGEVSRLQASLNIVHGPVFGAGLYRKDSVDYLVLVGHHLVVDGVSWRILLEDLFAGYGAAIGGGEIVLPDKTTSFKEWAGKLEEYATESNLEDEKIYWRDDLSGAEMALPNDHDLGPNDIGSSNVVREELNEDETGHLLRDAHKAYNTEVDDLLLAALMRAVMAWTGHDHIILDFEGHGREDVLAGVDTSRTVGWFTSIYPVVLRSDSNADLASHIKYVKEKLRSIPHRGFNYSVLRYMGDFDEHINAGISYNYLGQLTLSGIDGFLKLVRPDVPGTIDARNRRTNLIDVICLVMDSRLNINFVYSANKHKRETIQKLMQVFRDELSKIITHCLEPKNFDITPSDFGLAQLNQEELDSIYE